MRLGAGAERSREGEGVAIKIWYQSSVAIGKNPAFKPYEEAIARNVQQVVRPGTTVDIHGVEPNRVASALCRTAAPSW